MSTEAKNMTELNKFANKKLAELSSESISPPLAREIFNGIGKVIKLNLSQLEYRHRRKEKPELPFFE